MLFIYSKNRIRFCSISLAKQPEAEVFFAVLSAHSGLSVTYCYQYNTIALCKLKINRINLTGTALLQTLSAVLLLPSDPGRLVSPASAVSAAASEPQCSQPSTAAVRVRMCAVSAHNACVQRHRQVRIHTCFGCYAVYGAAAAKPEKQQQKACRKAGFQKTHISKCFTVPVSRKRTLQRESFRPQ